MDPRVKADRNWRTDTSGRAVSVFAAVSVCAAVVFLAAFGPGHMEASGSDLGDAAVIETVAGGGSVGEGGSALEARLHLPGGVLVAPDGDMIIVDFGNHRIRRVDRETGRIRAIVGTGEAGYNGDGIPAVEAQISRPEYAVFAPDGSLLIADSYNNRIRRIDRETGLISTVAGSGEKGFSGDGGPATEAALHFPEGIAVDSRGNLYIGDMVNRRIRRVDAETGIITTFAGTGQVGTSPDGTPAGEASFLRVARMATDAEGNVYLADSPSHTIQKIDLETRTLSTVAGTGTPGSDGDGGPALKAQIRFPEGILVAANGDIYFADAGNHRVRRIDARTGIIDSIAGTGRHGFSGDGGPAVRARLWSPGRLALDSDGNLLIADIGNSRIRRVDRRTGLISTVAGSGDLGDGGPAKDALLSVPGDVVYKDGKLYIADYGNRRVRRVDLGTGIIATVAGGGSITGHGIRAVEAELVLPEGIAVDRNHLFIADSSANRIWQVNLDTGLIYLLAGNGRAGFSGDGGRADHASLYLPGAVSVAPDGRVLIADFGNRRIRVVDPESGIIRSLESPSRYVQAHLQKGVVSFEATSDGLYQIVAEKTTSIERVNLERSVLEELSMGSSADRGSGESQIIDFAVYGDDMYAVDALGHRILRRNLANGHVEVVAGSGEQGFSGDGGPALQASLFQPGGVTVGAQGREIFIADAKNHRVRRVRFTSNP